MFEKFMNALKGGLAKLGIIKKLKDVSEHPNIAQNNDMFKRIERWERLYSGYDPDFHDIQYRTIDGVKDRRMKSLNMPKMVASEMASLVYNEKCAVNIDNEAVNDFVQEVFKNNKFDKNFQDYLEYSFATGGMVIKPYYDREKIMLSFVPASSFVPVSWRNGSIYEGVFIYDFVEKGKYYTHLEWHLWQDSNYLVKNELYRSETSDQLGYKVPLISVERLSDLEEEVPIANIKRSLFSYIRPNTANNFDLRSPLGVSLFSNALDTIESIDTAFDSFNREFRLGKKRILVPSKYIKTIIDPDTGNPRRYFDTSDETYEAYNDEMGEASDIKDISVVLRVEEHISAINAMLNLFAMQTGFSMGTFSFDGQSVKTATEVVSENSKTFKSKKSHETIIEASLQELVGSIISLGELYDLTSYTNDYEVTVSFDDSITEDQQTEINKQTQLVASELQSKKRAIMKIFGVPEKAALEIIEEIKKERQDDAPNERAVESAMFGSQE